MMTMYHTPTSVQLPLSLTRWELAIYTSMNKICSVFHAISTILICSCLLCLVELRDDVASATDAGKSLKLLLALIV
jgi:hypothetical protein